MTYFDTGVRMVQLACSCLNIRLHVRETAEALVPGVPGLKPGESQHPFFVKVSELACSGVQ